MAKKSSRISIVSSGLKEYQPDFFQFKVKHLVEDVEKESTIREIVGDARAVVIINVASRDQYAAKHLPIYQEMYESYKKRGLEILAFPCNQFDHGE